MLRIHGFRLRPDQKEGLKEELLKRLRIKEEVLHSYSLRYEKVGEGYLEYIIDLEVDRDWEEFLLEKREGLSRVPELGRTEIKADQKFLKSPPLIVSSDISGFFAAWKLAEKGFSPLLLEKGPPLSSRTTACQCWPAAFPTPPLDDPLGEEAVRYLIKIGAPGEIAYRPELYLNPLELNKMGLEMEKEIKENGGQVLYDQKWLDLLIEGGEIRGVKTNSGVFKAETIIFSGEILDTDLISLFSDAGFSLKAGRMAIGVRFFHPQKIVDRARYGGDAKSTFPPAGYSLNLRFPEEGRNVYSYRVVPRGKPLSCIEEERFQWITAVSGESKTCTGALAINLKPQELGDGPLSGFRFIRDLEKKQYQEGKRKGQIPAQNLEDFFHFRKSRKLNIRENNWKNIFVPSELNRLLPGRFGALLRGAMPIFARQVPGFDQFSTLLGGIETRIHSPVELKIKKPGLYFSGGMAGVANQTVSLAASGIKAAEQIGENFKYRGE